MCVVRRIFTKYWQNPLTQLLLITEKIHWHSYWQLLTQSTNTITDNYWHNPLTKLLPITDTIHWHSYWQLLTQSTDTVTGNYWQNPLTQLLAIGSISRHKIAKLILGFIRKPNTTLGRSRLFRMSHANARRPGPFCPGCARSLKAIINCQRMVRYPHVLLHHY